MTDSQESQSALPGHDALRELAQQKEKEWREIQELRTQTAETAYKEKEKQLEELQTKFNILKEDFKYNLRLIQERDSELERYDAIHAEYKTNLNIKNAEISDLNIQIDDLKSKLSLEIQGKEQLQAHYQQRLREKQQKVDQFRSIKEADIKKERDELESFKRNLERQLRETEDELDIQKREMSAGFDEVLKRREHEFRKQADEMSSRVLSYELKVKVLRKEVELLKTTQEKTAEEFEHVDQNHRALEKKLKEREWEINNTKAMKDARIQELESHLHQNQLSMKRLKEEFQRKYEERDKYAREKEMVLSQAKESHHETERQLQDNIRDLQSRLESSQVELRRVEWNSQDAMKDKDMQIERLEAEVQDLKSRWDAQLADVSRNTVSKDLEIQALKDNEQALKTELQQKKETVERYKKELSAALEREAGLERSKAQLELDWQRRHEQVERVQYEKSEDLVKNLTKARDEAIASVKEKSRELLQREDLIRVLTQDRDQALATLRQHGLLVDKNIDLSKFQDIPQSTSEQISRLQQQNESLRAVIHQMRQEMEHLGNELPRKSPRQQLKKGSSVTEDYVRMLEKEVKDLKSQLRELQTSKETPAKNAEEQTEVITASTDNPLVRSHIQSLNDTIGSLRAEKVELAAQVKKQQARILYLESMVEQMAKQPRQKQVEIDQLQYELGAQNRRYQAETASLRQRVAELELQVTECRKEADEYYKGNLERNMEATALGNELSALKMDMAQKIPTINYGAQELVIQQLKDEILRLRQQLSKSNGEVTSDFGVSKFTHGLPTSANIVQLQNKLKSAAKHISQLAREKQQLIEVGNRLRAELVKAGGKLSPPPHPRPSFPLDAPSKLSKPSRMTEAVNNKLNQLEKLQYELTKQELQQAKRPKEPDVIVELSSSETEEFPKPILKRPSSAEGLKEKTSLSQLPRAESIHTEPEPPMSPRRPQVQDYYTQPQVPYHAQHGIHLDHQPPLRPGHVPPWTYQPHSGPSQPQEMYKEPPGPRGQPQQPNEFQRYMSQNQIPGEHYQVPTHHFQASASQDHFPPGPSHMYQTQYQHPAGQYPSHAHPTMYQEPQRQSAPGYSEPAPEYQRTSSPGDLPFTGTGSSLGGESLQDIWRMLDEGHSPSLFTPVPQEEVVETDHPDNHVQAPRLQPTHQTTQKKATPLQGVVLGPGRRPDKDKNAAAKKTQKPKIRNYNIKDDKGMT